MNIGAAFVNDMPLSVDTKDDLTKVENIIKSNK
jgi:CMP-2-keto-3-deoxyoctulosonic acid synthetase